jgi:hypothetical protein
LFELLIALIWKRNGWEVEFLEEAPPAKRPDLRAIRGTDEWFIECKRLSKSSEYSEKERDKWLAMWSPFRDFLAKERIPFVFDIVFHVELHTLPDSYLLNELAGKIRFVHQACKVVSNEVWDVDVWQVDLPHIHEHLEKYSVRYPSDQLHELIGGHRDPNKGFTAIVKGRVERLGEGRGNNRFLDELEFAAGAFRSCDAPRAIEQKARDIRHHLADAVRQLPDNAKGAVHVGLETLDGAIVEEERYRRITQSVYKFDARGKNLEWVYCHLFQAYSPPEEMWVMDETVYYFGRTPGSKQPLRKKSAVVPDDGDSPGGVHWQKPPP